MPPFLKDLFSILAAAPADTGGDAAWSRASFQSWVSLPGGVEGPLIFLAQARQGSQHKLGASSFGKECLSEPQSGRVSMKHFIVQLAAGCPLAEGSAICIQWL